MLAIRHSAPTDAVTGTAVPPGNSIKEGSGGNDVPPDDYGRTAREDLGQGVTVAAYLLWI
jgi:hypothetical protein